MRVRFTTSRLHARTLFRLSSSLSSSSLSLSSHSLSSHSSSSLSLSSHSLSTPDYVPIYPPKSSPVYHVLRSHINKPETELEIMAQQYIASHKYSQHFISPNLSELDRHHGYPMSRALTSVYMIPIFDVVCRFKDLSESKLNMHWHIWFLLNWRMLDGKTLSNALKEIQLGQGSHLFQLYPPSIHVFKQSNQVLEAYVDRWRQHFEPLSSVPCQPNSLLYTTVLDCLILKKEYYLALNLFQHILDQPLHYTSPISKMTLYHLGLLCAFWHGDITKALSILDQLIEQQRYHSLPIHTSLFKLVIFHLVRLHRFDSNQVNQALLECKFMDSEFQVASSRYYHPPLVAFIDKYKSCHTQDALSKFIWKFMDYCFQNVETLDQKMLERLVNPLSFYFSCRGYYDDLEALFQTCPPSTLSINIALNQLCHNGTLRRTMSLFSRCFPSHSISQNSLPPITVASLPNAQTFTIMIHVYAKARMMSHSLFYFNRLKDYCHERNITFEIPETLIRSFLLLDDDASAVSLLYDKSDSPKPKSVEPRLWNLVLLYYRKRERYQEILDLYDKMVQFGITGNSHTSEVLIQTYLKMGNLKQAVKLLDESLLHRGSGVFALLPCAPGPHIFADLLEALLSQGNRFGAIIPGVLEKAKAFDIPLNHEMLCLVVIFYLKNASEKNLNLALDYIGQLVKRQESPYKRHVDHIITLLHQSDMAYGKKVSVIYLFYSWVSKNAQTLPVECTLKKPDSRQWQRPISARSIRLLLKLFAKNQTYYEHVCRDMKRFDIN